MYETIRPAEFASLIPLVSVSMIYWVRDRYIYNRVSEQARCKISKTQGLVALLYPIWAFLTWMRGLQTNRGHVEAAFITTTGEYIVAYYTVVGILNDSFRLTRQQMFSFPMGLLIAYIWTVFSLVIFLPHEEVCNVVGHNQTR